MPTITSTYSELRENFMIQAVNTENNCEMLQKDLHIELGDLSAVCKIVIENSKDGMKTVVVNRSLLNAIGITESQLFADAFQNSQLRFPATLRTMNEVIAEIIGVSPEDLPGESPLYVATCNDGKFGAGCIFYSDFLEKVSEKVGDFYVLPSSVHEVLILPDDGTMTAEELKEMVTSVNQQELSAQEKLSDEVFRYDSNTKKLSVFH